MLFEVRVEDGGKCLPACTRRSVDDGEDVRMERRWARVEMVVSSGTVMGIAKHLVSWDRQAWMDLGINILSPDKTLTKICIDSDCNSGEADLDEVALEGVDMTINGILFARTWGIINEINDGFEECVDLIVEGKLLNVNVNCL